MSEKKDNCECLFAYGNFFLDVLQWVKPGMGMQSGFWMMPPGREGKKGSWSHWRRTTSRMTLMLHLRISWPSQSCQHSPMAQIVRSLVWFTAIFFLGHLVIMIIMCAYQFFSIVEKRKKTRSNADHFKQVCSSNYRHTSVIRITNRWVRKILIQWNPSNIMNQSKFRGGICTNAMKWTIMVAFRGPD